jgi:hypothetical protein
VNIEEAEDTFAIDAVDEEEDEDVVPVVCTTITEVMVWMPLWEVDADDRELDDEREEDEVAAEDEELEEKVEVLRWEDWLVEREDDWEEDWEEDDWEEDDWEEDEWEEDDWEEDEDEEFEKEVEVALEVVLFIAAEVEKEIVEDVEILEGLKVAKLMPTGVQPPVDWVSKLKNNPVPHTTHLFCPS